MIFVYFHGSFGNPMENAAPYLKAGLEALGQVFYSEQYHVEDWEELTTAGIDFECKSQNLSNWLNTFEIFYDKRLSRSNQKVCFISHSIAPVFVLHILNKYPIHLDSAIFLSPFLKSLNNEKYWQFDVVNDSFYKTDFDFDKLKEQIDISYVLYSDNDPYVPIGHMLEFAERMGSSKIEIKSGKHLSESAGYKEFPLLLELCKTRIPR